MTVAPGTVSSIMLINTDLTPRAEYTDVVVLIDVLRTSTVAPMLLARGLERLALTPSMRSARAAGKDGWLLLGERNGLPPEGFNYGNSPTELSMIDFEGRRAVMVSENAPRWLPMLAGAKHVLLGSLHNASAVARVAAALATERIDLACCGFESEPDLDDSLAAGTLAGLLMEVLPDARFEGATRFCLALVNAFPDPLEGLWQSIAGHYLRRVGLEPDLAFAAQVSQCTVVPQRIAEEPGAGSAPLYLFGAHPD